MRELKFRFWSNILHNFVTPDDSIYRGVFTDPEMVVLQYTGLKDKNGVEIYEGDITKWYYGGNWVVEWHTGESRVGEIDDEWGDTIGFYISNHKTNPENGYRNYEPLTSDRIYEVIGNIYENPELLK